MNKQPLTLWRRSDSDFFGRALSRLQNDFDRLFGEIAEARQPEFAFSPSCELSEDKSSYTFKFDMPGVKKEDVKIELDQNQLMITAERREEKKSETKKSQYSEINYGSYQRSFTLPSSVDDKKVDAKFEDGVLTITLPKTETTKAKQISVH